MATSQREHENRTVPTKLETQKQIDTLVTGKGAAPPLESTLFAEGKSIAQFRFRILVVDDEPLLRETATLILESEGYEVFTAADGVEGLHALSKSLPDLIISDLNMPRMSGFEFLAVVRERFPQIATIAMSGGYSKDEIPLESFADAFLQKGNYTIKELGHQVGKLLAASPLHSEGKKSEIALLRDIAGRPNKLEAMS